MPSQPVSWAAAVAGLVILAMPGLAAAEDDPFDRTGAYIGVSGLYQHNVFENRIENLLQNAAAPLPVSLSIGDSGGAGGLLGFRLASFFAAELQYEWVDEFEVAGSISGSPTGSIYSITGHTLTGNTRFILPFWRVQPYLLLGVGFSSKKVDAGILAAAAQALDPRINIGGGSRVALAARGGLGLDLYLTQNIVINAQGQIVLTTLEKPGLGDIDDLNYVGFSAGLQYHF